MESEEENGLKTEKLAAKIEKARQELRDGETVSLKSHEDIERYFESM